MPLRPLLAVPLCATLLAGCVTFSASPTPNAALLLACTDPVLAADPETATDNDMASDMLALGLAYKNCKQRHGDLATWARGR